MLSLEKNFDVIDLFWDKYLVERESLHEEKSKEIQRKIFTKN